jgi:hypothetical protein
MLSVIWERAQQRIHFVPRRTHPDVTLFVSRRISDGETGPCGLLDFPNCTLPSWVRDQGGVLMQDFEQAIRERAYQLWIEGGRQDAKTEMPKPIGLLPSAKS